MPDTAQDLAKARFTEALHAVPANGSPAWLKSARARAAAAFAQAEWPHTRMEEWRQTNIAAINKTPWHSLIAPGPDRVTRDEATRFFYNPGVWHELVFVDGFFVPQLGAGPALPRGVQAGSLQAALHSDQTSMVQEHLGRYLGNRNAYTVLNSAFLLDGAFVHIARNTLLPAPIHLVFISRREAPDAAAHLRNLILLEEGAQAAVVTSYVSLAGNTRYLNNVVEEIALAPNASLAHYKLVEEGPQGNHLATTEVCLHRDSRLTSHAITLSGAVTRNQLCIALDGENAETQLSGLYLNDRDRLTDNALRIEHRKPHCRSRIAYKGILGDQSRAVFAGYVNVFPNAQKTDSDQLSNNLLLSNEATIDAKPQLEIFADDVKCTHGATIGSFPAPILFYFRTRGIDEATARGMLTYGFAGEILNDLPLPELAGRLDRYVYEKYSPKFA